MIAYTRAVPPSIGDGERTHVDAVAIDVPRAVAQHAEYEVALRRLGCTVARLPDEPGLPDSVFVEDTAVVLPELAVIARPGAPSRRPEVDSVVELLGEHRELVFIEEPGTLDGGDVLVLGRDVWVGDSRRTNRAGFDQLRSALLHHGYQVRHAPVRGCLHLKSAATAIGDGAILLNSGWTATDRFAGVDLVEVPEREPHAANVLRLGDAVLMPAGHPATRDLLLGRGLDVHEVDVAELMKAEAGVTCCSIIVD